MGQIELYPELLLRELVYGELDKIVVKSEEHNGGHIAGDEIPLALQAVKLSFQEYEKLKAQGRTNELADLCVEELKRRNCHALERAWSVSIVGILGEWKTIKLDKSVFLNQEPPQMNDEITCADYREMPRREEVLKNNKIQFVKNVQAFYEESCRYFGEEFYEVIGKNHVYIIEGLQDSVEIEDDLDLCIKLSDNFILEKDVDAYKKNNGSRPILYDSLNMQDMVMSWHRFWRILFEDMIIKYLISDSMKGIGSDNVEDIRYFKNILDTAEARMPVMMKFISRK